ncbi:hypothetical protein NDU88_010975 [Pleurodeles waltl]|uniref:Uncharacterized protein n=1 Tax=Pleurodeles waltl TaxID=8319 RepID=A0AAV7R1R1_PLEWA|nr:hypothetical protein NDU88_010975 [Pleurodeles waltl]
MERRHHEEVLGSCWGSVEVRRRWLRAVSLRQSRSPVKSRCCRATSWGHGYITGSQVLQRSQVSQTSVL